MWYNSKKIENKFKKFAPKLWWGDHLDVRFYLISELKQLKNKKILDLGCGSGILLSELDNNNKKFGIDISKKNIKIAKKLNPNANLIIGDLTKLPIKTNVIDVISAANVIPGADFSVDNKKKLQEKMINEIIRVMKKNGQLFLTTPNSIYYKRWFKNPDKLLQKGLKKLLQPHFKFEIKTWNPFPPWPHFLPGRILANIPGIFILLRKIKSQKGKYFFIYGVKR